LRRLLSLTTATGSELGEIRLMFNPSRQRRYQFIRARHLRDLDDVLLPLARLVDRLTPCSVSEFNEKFDKECRKLLPEAKAVKTRDNFRTEIVRSLFGLVIFDAEVVKPSDRLGRLLESSDQTAFFREIAWKFQFPFGAASPREWKQNQDLSLRPGPFLLQLLDLADKRSFPISQDEIFFYVLNSEDVQKGLVSPDDVLKCLVGNRLKGSLPKGFPVPRSSKNRQHLGEFLRILELGSLIAIEGDRVNLRKISPSTKSLFLEVNSRKIEFTDSGFVSRKFRREAWDLHYTTLDESTAEKLAASVPPTSPGGKITATELGKLGEQIAVASEIDRLSQVDRSLARRVKDRSKEKEIGFDIESVRGDLTARGRSERSPIYIEVKTTRRNTKVKLYNFPDGFDMQRSQWEKAKTSRTDFFIYRVFVTDEGNQIVRICDPYGKAKASDAVSVIPKSYEVDILLPDHELFDA